jgi:cyclopropane-fatty-acyl-phospholipid synthase
MSNEYFFFVRHDYSRTLLAWLENFKKNWPTIQSKYGPRFYRMWNYYLQFSAGSFKSRRFQLWQVRIIHTYFNDIFVAVILMNGI